MIRKCAIIYICALLLLLTAETSGTEKFCRIRDLPLYPQELWDYIAGYFCYNYTNSYRLIGRYNITATSVIHNNVTYSIPITRIDNTTFFTYNYKNNVSLTYIRKSFKTDYFFDLWKDCCSEAEECCNNILTNENIMPTEEYPCPALWDGWTCFEPAKKGTIEKTKCSKQAYSTESDVCELESEKECFSNGTWNQKTNYETCAMAPVLRTRHNFNIISLSIASVLALPAVAIFFSLRNFRKNLRYVMHRNLILVIIIRNLLSIMSKKIIILDAINSTDEVTVMSENSVACRSLAFFENAAKNGMYACMLADGFYLHKLIVRAFATEPNVLYIYLAVAILSFLPSLIWALVRDSHGGTDCWMVDDTNDQWIIDGFRIGILILNFLLLLDIIRVMIIKLKRGSIPQQAKSTLRATLFLIPLFGIHIVVITNRNMVPSNTCQAENVYFYISYLIEGLQGVMVAILFCYINSEVHKELSNAFRKFALYLESRFDIRLRKNQVLRRETAATYVDPHENK